MRLPRTAWIFALAALPAVADIGPKPRMYASGMEARGKDMSGLEIEMTAEEVDVKLVAGKEKRTEFLVVDAVFHMTNLGGETELEEGFPVGPHANMTEFSISIEGKEVDFELVDLNASGPGIGRTTRDELNKPRDYWYLWKAKYPAGALCRHVVHYKVHLSHPQYTMVNTSYILHTGAPWKNPIGKAVVRFHTEGLSSSFVYAVSPVDGVRRDGDVWTWTFENLEPTEAHDIRIRYNDEQTWDQEVAELRKDTGDFTNAPLRLCERLLEAASRHGRAVFTKEELADLCAAFGAVLKEAKATEKGVEVTVTKESKRPLTVHGWGEFVFENFEEVVSLVERHPGSVEALTILRGLEPLAEAISSGRLTGGGRTYKLPEYLAKKLPQFDATRARAAKLTSAK